MQYTGGSLYQGVSLESIVAGLTGATGVEGVILSNQADFNTKNTAVSAKNTSQDNALSALETKAAGLESGATGLEGRNTALDAALVVVQSREDALLAGLTGASGLENRAVGFNTNITAINANLNGNIQEQINTKVADSIFQSLKTEFETDFMTFQNQLNQKVVTATQEVLDARQDSDDAVLEKKFCSIEEFAQTFLQTYTVAKPDGTPYKFDGKIQKVDKAPPIFSIIEKTQNGTAWDLKIKLTDYGYNVMSGNLIVKGPTGTVLHTLNKSLFNSTTKLYALTLANSNSSGTLINGPYTFEYQASTSTAVYSLVLNSAVIASIPLPLGVLGTPVWGKWIGDGTVGNIQYWINDMAVTTNAAYIIGTRSGDYIISGTLPSISGMGTRPTTYDTSAYVIKVDISTGAYIWGKWLDGWAADTDYRLSIAGDDVYVIAKMKVTSSNNDLYIAKLDKSNGNTLWSNWIRGIYDESFPAIYATTDGLYIAGASSSGLTDTIGTLIGTKPTNPLGTPFVGFICRVNVLTGSFEWAKWIDSVLFPKSILVNSNSVYVITTGIYIVKYSLSGTFDWKKQIYSPSMVYTGQSYITADSLFISGNATANLSINGINNGTKPGYAGGNTPFVIRLDLSGNGVWLKWIHDSFTYGIGMVGTSEHIYIMCGLYKDWNVSGTLNTLLGTKPYSNQANEFVAKLDIASGDFIWAKWLGYGNNSPETNNSGLVYSSGSVYIFNNSSYNLTSSIGNVLGNRISNAISYIIKLV